MAKKLPKVKMPENRQKKRRNPKDPPKEYQFKPGQSGNPGGRPKLLSNAYREWLAEEDENGVTNARKVAIGQGFSAASGDTPAAKEIRQATEGERTRTWEDEIVELLREGKVSPEQVEKDLPDDAPRLFISAGIRRSDSGEVQAPSASPTDTGGSG